MTDQELLKAYKEAIKKQWESAISMTGFNKHLLESKKLEQQIVVRWVNMMQEKEES